MREETLAGNQVLGKMARGRSDDQTPRIEQQAMK